MSDSNRSVLFVHHRDISTTYGTTVPYYLSKKTAESDTVHVVCRAGLNQDDAAAESAVRYHRIDTGQVPVLSGILFHLLSTVYAAVLTAVHRFDAVYTFQRTLLQGWLAAAAGGSRFVAGLQSVPIRQRKDFLDSGTDPGARKRLKFRIMSLYAAVVAAALRRSTEVVCLTKGIRRVTEREYDLDMSDAHVIGMGVDVEAFAPAAAEPADAPAAGPGGAAEAVAAGGTGGRRTAEPDTWTLAYVGALGGVRGIEHVIEAVARTDHDVEFRVAGGGQDEYVRYLEERCEELGVADRVEWCGLIPHEDVPELLREADIAISPLHGIESYRISFPAKLLEYMASGSVVFATDMEAHRNLIDDGTNGVLYERGSSGLVAALDRCIGSGSLDRRALEAAALETARSHDWDVVVRKQRSVMYGDAADA